MTSQNPVEAAKQGNPQAIAALLNRSLQPKGITAKAAVKNDCLQIRLESAQVAPQKPLVEFVRKGISALAIESVSNIKLSYWQTGEDFPSWSEDFDLGVVSTTSPPKQATEADTLPTPAVVSTNLKHSKTNLAKPATAISPKPTSKAKSSSHSPFTKLRTPHSLALVAVVVGLFTAVSWGALKMLGASPGRSVEAFASALSKGDEQSALKHWCFQSGSTLYAIRSWKVIRQDRKQFEINSENLLKHFPAVGDEVKELSKGTYTEVVARIESSNKGGMPITNDWVFRVWKTKDLKRQASQANKVMALLKETKSPDASSLSIEQLLEESKVQVAKTDFLIAALPLVGDEGRLTSQAYCIGALKEK